MQSKFSLLIIALIVCSAAAQKGVRPPPPVVPISKKPAPTTAPKPIEESEHRKECPAGFNFVGKQCAKTLTAQPETICPKGTVLVDNKCTKYVGKESECPSGYVEEKGSCKKTTTVMPETVCPPEYTLRGENLCVIKVALPQKQMCPAGSVKKGDGCTAPKAEAPEYVCAGGYQLIGKRCQREETFDCTPTRRNPHEEEAPAKNGDSGHGGANQPHPAPGKGETSVYQLPANPPVVQEYIIQKTCKRIITEPARPVCPSGGNFDGKMCQSDVPVNPIYKPGGFEEKVVPASKVCPDGYLESSSNGECTLTEEVLPDMFCPAGSYDLGERCATYTKPKSVCPDGFSLDAKICTKTVFAAPLVEYTVTYACTGKDCGRQ